MRSLAYIHTNLLTYLQYSFSALKERLKLSTSKFPNSLSVYNSLEPKKQKLVFCSLVVILSDV